MDRLSVLKVLADRSRYAIYREVAAAPAPLATLDLAARLALHPNTVRLHLEKLRDAGLVEVSTGGGGSVGRPQHRWAASAHAPSLGLEPAGFRLLAHLLAEALAEGPRPAERAAAVGRRQAAERAAHRQAGERPARRQPRTGSRGTSPGPGWLRAVAEELADLGFDPVPDGAPSGSTAALAFAACPFRELAERYPEVICGLHRGLIEGAVAGLAAGPGRPRVQVAALETLLEATSCRVELSARP